VGGMGQHGQAARNPRASKTLKHLRQVDDAVVRRIFELRGWRRFLVDLGDLPARLLGGSVFRLRHISQWEVLAVEELRHPRVLGGYAGRRQREP
jgi:hypothetical protein